jgi:two-component system repressor protein LuxO
LPLLQAGRVGGRGPTLDVRIVSATHRDPMEEVRAGRLREDLFYRLNVIPVALPPLRDRGADVIAIAQHFLERSAAEEAKSFERLAPDAQALLQRHSWPGNVRELQNAIRTAIVLHDGPAITASMLPVALHNAAMPAGRRAADGTERIRPLAVVERDAIEEAIALCGGNVARAAAFLGLAPSTLYRKRQSWDAGVSRTG